MQVGPQGAIVMRHNTTLLTAAMVILAMAVAPFGAAAVASQPAAAEGAQMSMVAQENETADNDSVSPGAQLSGIVGVQEAEVGAAIEQREFGIRMAKAATNDSEAEVINQTAERLQERLNKLEEKKQRLAEARENGSMSKDQFAARMAQVHAQSKAISQLANATENESKQLPEDVLRENGVNVTAIKQLQESAQNLTGPETAAIARSIAGPNVGNVTNVTQGPPANKTGDASQAIQQAAAAVERAQANVEKAEQRVSNESSDAADALETAQTKLELAKSKLAEARAAAADGDSDEAARLAKQAKQHANASLDAARTAIQQAGDGTTGGTTTTSGGTTTADGNTTTTTSQG